MYSRKCPEVPFALNQDQFLSNYNSLCNPQVLLSQIPNNLFMISNQNIGAQNHVQMNCPTYNSYNQNNFWLNASNLCPNLSLNPSNQVYTDSLFIPCPPNLGINYYISSNPSFYNFSPNINSIEGNQPMQKNNNNEPIDYLENCKEEKKYSSINIDQIAEKKLNPGASSKNDKFLYEKKSEDFKMRCDKDKNLNNEELKSLKNVIEEKNSELFSQVRKCIKKRKHFKQRKFKRFQKIKFNSKKNCFRNKKKIPRMKTYKFKKEEDKVSNIDMLLNLDNCTKRPLGKKHKSQIASTKYRVNGKFVSRSSILKILGPNIRKIAEHPFIHKILNLSLGYTLSAEIQGFTFYNFDKFLQDVFSEEGFPLVNSLSNIDITLKKVDKKRKNIVIKVNFLITVQLSQENQNQEQEVKVNQALPDLLAKDPIVDVKKKVEI